MQDYFVETYYIIMSIKIDNGYGEIIKSMINLHNELSLCEEATKSTILQSLDDFINVQSTPIVSDSNEVLVAFSGGKDSTYLTLDLISKGLKPTLVYVKGINKGFNETLSVISISKKLNLPLKIIDVHYKNTGSNFVENPLKNAVILSMLFDLGIRYKIDKFAFGNHVDCSIEDANIKYNLGDAFELLEKVYKLGSFIFPNLEYFNLDVQIKDIYCKLHEVRLLGFINSCMTTIRYRDYCSRIYCNKFNIENPLPNRCFSCYKCCTELLMLSDLGHFVVKSRMIRHAIRQIKKNWDKIVLPNKPSLESLTEKDIYYLIINKS